jgi:hypothetical protein
MCNRFVQKGREVRPGQQATVLMRGPGGEFEVPFDEAIFGGPARSESRSYWIKREGAEPVVLPDIERFGEKDKANGQQNWEMLARPAAMEGLLLPQPPGKDYRLLKVVTQAATVEQIARLGNDRVPIFTTPVETVPVEVSGGLPAVSEPPAPAPTGQMDLPI